MIVCPGCRIVVVKSVVVVEIMVDAGAAIVLVLEAGGILVKTVSWTCTDVTAVESIV